MENKIAFTYFEGEPCAKEQRIKELRELVRDYKVEKLKELSKMSGPYGIQDYEDILEPIDFNWCDRCGRLGHKVMDLYWIADLKKDTLKKVTRLMQNEPRVYDAVCVDCLTELKVEILDEDRINRQ